MRAKKVTLRRSTWAGYFLFSMYDKSPMRNIPNVKKAIIVWKVSIKHSSFPEKCRAQIAIA